MCSPPYRESRDRELGRRWDALSNSVATILPSRAGLGDLALSSTFSGLESGDDTSDLEMLRLWRRCLTRSLEGDRGEPRRRRCDVGECRCVRCE